MPEAIPNNEEGQHDLKEKAKHWANERLGWINELVVELGGEGAKVEDILPEPTAVRDEAPMPNWTPEQTVRAREIGQRFGYGAEQDVPSGLTGAVVIAEGGKVWKIMAEAEALKAESAPARIIFSGSANRALGDDELTFLRDKKGVTLPAGTTEYEAARWVARAQVTNPAEQPEVLSFGYAVAEGNPLTDEATGQLVKIGETDSGQSVELLRIDREDYTNEANEAKFRNQPISGRVMELISESLSKAGDETTPIVFVTSNTYASKQVNEVRAGIANGRQFGVALYGRQTIVGLGAPVPAEMPLNHLPGDLRAMHDKLQQLHAELSQ
ncbi:MAG TPA: hypothetical protein VMT23_01805 [Candidatus Binatia bacterium]|nr:hypothetical protein [Candidatus Binatia bacterium]